MQALVTHREASANVLTQAPAAAPRVVMLTSIVIGMDGIFRNGLYQNVYVLAKLIRNLGYRCIILTERPSDGTENERLLNGEFEVMPMQQYQVAPFRIHYVIEVALGLTPEMRRFLKLMGARVTKLYLGNTLNIDTEIPMNMLQQTFSHHLMGDLDEIWTSPHYAPNVPFNAAIDNVAPERSYIVPYVWLPMFISDEASKPCFYRKPDYPPAAGTRNFLIIEPNISFQKSSLIPLMIIEEIYRLTPEKVGTVTIIGGDRMKNSIYFTCVISPGLTILKQGGPTVRFLERASLKQVLSDPAVAGACVVANQISNEYNYIMMELLHFGYPYVHNCTSLRDYGYYYSNNSISSGVTAVRRVFAEHDTVPGRVEAQAAQIAYRFSPANPEILKIWGELLEPGRPLK